MSDLSALIDGAKLISNNRRNAAIADADWVTFINWGIESWAKFRISLDPGLFFGTKDVTLTGGASGSTVNLASGFTPNFRSLHGVDLNPDTSSRMTVRSTNFAQRNDGVGPWIPAPFCPVRRYDVRALTLTITPYENAAGNYRVYYRGAPSTFVGTSDTNPLDTVFQPDTEALCLLAACMALRIEETADDPWTRRLNEIRTETAAACDRDDGAAYQIADVEELGSGWGYP